MSTYGQLQSHIDTTTGRPRDNEGGSGAPYFIQVDPAGIAADVDTGDSEMFSGMAYALAGAALAIAPNSDLSSVPAAADIPVMTLPTGSVRKHIRASCTTDNLATNNHLGWILAIDPGSAVAARDRIVNALDDGTIAYYTAAGGRDFLSINTGTIFVPARGEIDRRVAEAVSKIYAMPVAVSATSVGVSILHLEVS